MHTRIKHPAVTYFDFHNQRRKRVWSLLDQWSCGLSAKSTEMTGLKVSVCAHIYIYIYMSDACKNAVW